MRAKGYYGFGEFATFVLVLFAAGALDLQNGIFIRSDWGDC